MIEYLIEWGHTYIMHFGAWVSFMIAATVYKSGVPDVVDKFILRTIFLSAFIALFSSHSHHHYLNHFSDKSLTPQKVHDSVNK